MIYFLSNHKDTSFLEQLTGEKIELIPHPYIEPEWSEEEVDLKCNLIIRRCVQVENLIMNGDYYLVASILIRRHGLCKKTGFIAMKKLNEPSNEKDSDGNIVHRNILKPVGIRWL